MKTYRVDHRKISITINCTLYDEEVLYKCLYWYGDTYAVSVERNDEHYEIQIEKLEGTISDELFSLLVNKIKTDLIDFKTRQIIARETDNIKQIMIAKAFSSFDEFDEAPTGEINDPLGFSIDQ